MYKWIGFSGLSASRKSNCATMDAESVSSTCPFRQTTRSLSNLEKISSVGAPSQFAYSETFDLIR